MGLSYPFRDAQHFSDCLAVEQAVQTHWGETKEFEHAAEIDGYVFIYRLAVDVLERELADLSDATNYFNATLLLVETAGEEPGRAYEMRHVLYREGQDFEISKVYQDMLEEPDGIEDSVLERMKTPEMKNVVCAHLEKLTRAIKDNDKATLEWFMEASKITGFNIFDPATVVRRFPDLKEAEAFTLDRAA